MKQPNKKTKENPKLFCTDCKHSTFDTKFENLSVDGKPTLIICPFQKWKIVVPGKGCGKYEPKN